MPEWTVLIADDEPAARRGVRQLLAAYPEFAVAAECRNGAEVLTALDRVQPHVVFLDVQMPGLGGFDVIGRRTPERMPIVVFLTAYEEHALRAFEVQALDYLVKPVAERRFAAAMARIVRQLRMQSAAPRVPRIVVQTPRGTSVIALSDVEWIEAADNYSRVWSRGRGYLLRRSLATIESRIRAHGFIRTHRQALVSLACAQALESTREGDLVVVLRSGTRVPVARRRRGAVAAALRSLAG